MRLACGAAVAAGIAGLVVGTALGAPALGDSAGPPFPRLANVWLHGAVSDSALVALARWDVVVVDPVWTPQQLDRLRELRPDIKLFAYVCPYCIHAPPNRASPWELENFNYAQAEALWWYDRHSRIAADWPNTNMINVTGLGPVGPQGAWAEYLVARVTELMHERPALDGVFYDNFWRAISWEQDELQLDSDCNPRRSPEGCDGRADAPAWLDSLWNAALRQLAHDTRRGFDALEEAGRERPLAILGNGVSDYYEWLNGAMHERFPEMGGEPDPGNPYGYRWSRAAFGTPGGYLLGHFRPAPYVVQIVNAAAEGDFVAPARSGRFERHKRFTFCAALLGDGYYSLDPAALGHGALWWEPEYDHDGRGRGYLGWPKGPARRLGADGSGPLRRDFDHGIVLVNDSAEPRTVALERSWHRLLIRGSPVFDGAAVRRERIAPFDGRILLDAAPEPAPGEP
jgi:hypothetical protein